MAIFSREAESDKDVIFISAMLSGLFLRLDWVDFWVFSVRSWRLWMMVETITYVNRCILFSNMVFLCSDLALTHAWWIFTSQMKKHWMYALRKSRYIPILRDMSPIPKPSLLVRKCIDAVFLMVSKLGKRKWARWRYSSRGGCNTRDNASLSNVSQELIAKNNRWTYLKSVYQSWC